MHLERHLLISWIVKQTVKHDSTHRRKTMQQENNESRAEESSRGFLAFEFYVFWPQSQELSPPIKLLEEAKKYSKWPRSISCTCQAKAWKGFSILTHSANEGPLLDQLPSLHDKNHTLGGFNYRKLLECWDQGLAGPWPFWKFEGKPLS